MRLEARHIKVTNGRARSYGKYKVDKSESFGNETPDDRQFCFQFTQKNCLIRVTELRWSCCVKETVCRENRLDR